MQTARIAFSRWTPDDGALAQRLWGDAAVTRLISKTGRFTAQEIADRLDLEIANEQRYHLQYWPIFDRATGDFLGCCGLRPYDAENRVYEIGVHLCSAVWGKGLAREAAEAVMRYADEHLNAAALFAGHNPRNTSSKKVLEQLGFAYTGDAFYPPTGLNHPSYRYEFPSK